LTQGSSQKGGGPAKTLKGAGVLKRETNFEPPRNRNRKTKGIPYGWGGFCIDEKLDKQKKAPPPPKEREGGGLGGVFLWRGEKAP